MPRKDNTNPLKSDFTKSERCRGCVKDKTQAPKMLRCGQCGQAYCSRDCQKKDWPIHKNDCKPELTNNQQDFRDIRLFIREYEDKIHEANLCCRNLFADPETAFNTVYVVNLVPRKNRDYANIATFFEVVAITKTTIERFCKGSKNYAAHVAQQQAAHPPEEYRGLFHTLFSILGVPVRCPITQTVKHKTFNVLSKAPPFSSRDWPTMIKSAVAAGDADSSWYRNLLQCLVRRFPFPRDLDHWQANIAKWEEEPSVLTIFES